jgi:hypothetical protein
VGSAEPRLEIISSVKSSSTGENMYPPTFPQSDNNFSTFPIGGNGASGQLPYWQGNPAQYAQNPYAQSPYGHNPQAQGGASFAPQGFLGSLLGSTAGRLLGGLAGQGNLGRILGGAAGTLLPLQAGPQYQQPGQADFDPQGFGSFFKKMVSIIPDAVKVATTVAKVLPLQAGPQSAQQGFAPQGWGGDLLAQLAQTAGGHVGGPWGQAIQGAGPLISHLSPFQAGPQYMQPGQYQQLGQYQQPGGNFDPQGFGSFFKKMVSIIPDAVKVATTVAKVLPLQAGPQQQQLQPQQLQQFDPQGLWSSLTRLAGQLPNLANAAQQLGLLQAGPMGAQQSFAPQGWGGDLLGQLAQTAGGYVGGPWGQAIGGAGPLISHLSPFQAGPQGHYPQPGQYQSGQYYSGQSNFDPQGFGSFFKKMVSIIPDAVKVATTVAKVLPLQAGPQFSSQPQMSPQPQFSSQPQMSPQSIFQSPYSHSPIGGMPMWPYLGISPFVPAGQA